MGFEGGESGGTPCSRRDQGHIMIVGGGEYHDGKN